MRPTIPSRIWISRRTQGVLAVLALGLVLGACSGYRAGIVYDTDELVAALRDRGLDPRAVVHPFAVNEEMKSFALETVGEVGKPEERLLRLQRTLLDPQQIAVKYQWGYTATASEVWTEKKANCLAFTNLFVGLARELGLEVYFLGVRDIENFRREGDLVVISDHIAVGHGPPQDRLVFDFSENPPDDYVNFRPVSDLTAIAMFHSNRGAESLQAGYAETAIDWLEKAVEIDPSLSNAWVNLGVSRRRADDLDGAEEAYRRAIAIDPRIFSAYQNLASLLRLEGRQEEARAYEEILASSPSRNPFTYLSLGDVSLQRGRIDEAERLYRRAVRLSPDDPEPYAALGALALSKGQERIARKMLKEALKLAGADANNRVKNLAQLLAAAEKRG